MAPDDLRLNSLIARAEVACRTPGIGCTISPSDFRLRIEVEEKEQFLAYLVQDLHFSVERAQSRLSSFPRVIDLPAIEKGMTPYKEALSIIFPAQYQNALSAPLIAVAHHRSNLAAMGGGIVAINEGVITHIGAYSFCATLLLTRFAGSTQEQKAYLFEGIVELLRSATRLTTAAAWVTDFIEAVQTDMDRSLGDWRNRQRSLEARFIMFLLAHEYGHVALEHHLGKTPLTQFPSGNILQLMEIEADTVASATMAIWARRADLPIYPVGFQCAVCLYCVSIALEDADPEFFDDLFKPPIGIGHPPALERLLLTLIGFEPGEAVPTDPEAAYLLNNIQAFHTYYHTRKTWNSG